jgi:uncharacterized membrane protein
MVRLYTRRKRSRELPLLAGAGLGAGLMYLVDPDRGARRRALVRDKSVHALHRIGDVIEKGSRDLGFRIRGLVAETRSLRHGEPAADELLTPRVRSKMGRAVSHPHAIGVAVANGQVTLTGPILAREVPGLLGAVAAVPGVTGIENHLEPHDPEDPVPALEGGRHRTAERLDLLREHWAPLTRIVMGALGGGLVASGLVRRDRAGALLAGAGVAILARDVANRPLRRVLGIGAGRRAVDFHKTLHVRAPIEDVYAFFTRVENFPRFMAHVREVKKLGEDRYHWIAEGPARIPVGWDAEVTRRVANEVFAWRSVPGAVIANAGVARFERDADGGTRLDIQMSYNPPGGALGHLVASLFGADPKHALDEDLVRFQSLLQRGKTTAHHHVVRAEELR